MWNSSRAAGTVTALVGATGAGKSTLMSLLLRLYDPVAGAVRINGVDLRDLAIDDLRASIAIALQQNVLFAATVEENIGYASPNASAAQIEAAARVACADEFIGEMANGYDTELGERGGKLSTGQTSSGCPSPGPSCARRRSWFSTNRPLRSTPRPNSGSWRTCRDGAGTGSCFSSPTDSPPSAMRIRSPSSMGATLRRPAITTP